MINSLKSIANRSANHSLRNNLVLDSAPATAAFEVEMEMGDDKVGSEGKGEMGRSVLLPGTSSTPPPLLTSAETEVVAEGAVEAVRALVATGASAGSRMAHCTRSSSKWDDRASALRDNEVLRPQRESQRSETQNYATSQTSELDIIGGIEMATEVRRG